MPRKRLFPPPLHPETAKPLQNKGTDEHTILTINGRISLSRRRYAAPGVGSSYPLDTWLDRAEDSLSLGLREMACRLNLAPAGQVINASEEKVRDLFADFRQTTFQTAVQLRLDAAQAAFSPSAPS